MIHIFDISIHISSYQVERVRKDGRGVDKDEDDGRCIPGTGTGGRR